MPNIASTHNSLSPAFAEPCAQRSAMGTLRELAVTKTKTPADTEHLVRRFESVCSFKGERFSNWASTKLEDNVARPFDFLIRYFNTDANTRYPCAQAAAAATPTPSPTSSPHSPMGSNTSQPSDTASNFYPRHETPAPPPSARPVSIQAQSELSAAGTASDKRIDLSPPGLPQLGAGNPLQITDLLLALSSKNASIDQSLPALLCSLSCFIKDTEERLAPQRPGVHTMAKQLGLCLGHLEQAQARSVLTKLEGELGSSAHSVIQFAGHRVRCERKSATPALVRLSQCEYLLKGLMHGLRSHLHDVGARTSLQTPGVKDFNRLSPLERTAFRETLSV